MVARGSTKHAGPHHGDAHTPWVRRNVRLAGKVSLLTPACQGKDCGHTFAVHFARLLTGEGETTAVEAYPQTDANYLYCTVPGCDCVVSQEAFTTV